MNGAAHVHTSNRRSIVIVIIVLAFAVLAFFPDGDLDALGGKAFAERRAVADAREFLGRVDGKGRAVAAGQNGGLASLAAREGRAGRADVDEGEAESGRVRSAGEHATARRGLLRTGMCPRYEYSSLAK